MNAPNSFAEMRQQIEDAPDLPALIQIQLDWIGHAEVSDDTTAQSQRKFLLEYVDAVEADAAAPDDLADENCTGSYP